MNRYAFNLAVLLIITFSTFSEASPVEIDSKKDCLRIGGKWTPIVSKSLTHVCIAHLSYEKCQDKGGGVNSERRCQFFLSERQFATQCKKKGGIWQGVWCFFEKDRTKCIKDGGIWTVIGKNQDGCVKRSTDGGKPCTKSSQCLFNRCYYVKRHGEQIKSATDSVIGECARTDNPSQCGTFVHNGQIAGSGCGPD